MRNLPPLVGLMYDLHYYNERFHRLSTILLDKGFAAFQQEFRENDAYIDDNTKVSLLHIAAAGNNMEAIHFFVQQGIDINTQDIDGNTPLHFAALTGCEEAVNTLLSLGANVDTHNDYNLLPWQAARTGELMQKLLPEKSLSKLPKKSLYEAVETEDIEEVQTLLELGVHPNLLNERDYQVEFRLPIHIAVDTKNLALTELLLKNGAKPDYPNHYVHVPLENAIKQENTEMVELLLRYRADPNHHMGNMPSLLHLATRRNALEILELLLQYGADPEVQIGGHYFYHPPLRDAESTEAIDILIRYGAKTDPEMMKDFLVWPIGRGDTEIVKKFIEIGVPVRSSGLWNEAIRGSNRHNQTIPLCKVLLEAGLDVNEPINYFGTPLIRAIHYRNIELINLFLDHGADLNVTDPDSGFTPYELAFHLLDQKVINLLAERMQKAKLPLPEIQPAPTIDNVNKAIKKDHSDFTQLSLYGINPDNHFKLLNTLKEKLGYRKEAIPFMIQSAADEEEEYYEEWDESYKPPLSDYQILFHPTDARCYILLINWYDDFNYSTIYHLHVCCEKKYEKEIQALFQHWYENPDEETDKDLIDRYQPGVYHCDWIQGELSDEDKSRLEEAQSFYISAVETVQKKLG